MPFDPLGRERFTGIFAALGACRYFFRTNAVFNPAFPAILGYPFTVAAIAKKVVDGYLRV